MVQEFTKITKIGIFSFLILFVFYSHLYAEGEDEELTIYKQFFTVTGAEAQYNQMLDIMISQFQQGFTAGLKKTTEKLEQDTQEKEKEQMKQLIEETMKQYLQRLRLTINEIMPFGELVENVYYPVYSKHFTVTEIQEMMAFFETPVGQKFVAVTPTLMQEAVILINQKYTSQLQEMSLKIAEEELMKIQSAVQKLRSTD